MGIMYKTISKTVFPRHTPSVPLPPSGPLRHSGESRNPEDTFPLDPGFRRGDEGGLRERAAAELLRGVCPGCCH